MQFCQFMLYFIYVQIVFFTIKLDLTSITCILQLMADKKSFTLLYCDNNKNILDYLFLQCDEDNSLRFKRKQYGDMN
jgi:hypothetical protein